MESTSIGDEVRRLRKIRNWSLERLCEEVKIPLRTLSRIENNRCKPRTEAWLKLERWFLECGLQEDELARFRPPISLGWLARKAELPRHFLARYQRIFDQDRLKNMEAEHEDPTDEPF